MATLLEGLRHTVIVADTGDLEVIACLRPRDATTAPSPILTPAGKRPCQALIGAAAASTNGETAAEVPDRVLVAFGLEFLRRIDGRVSTEMNAQPSLAAATFRKLIALCETQGIGLAGSDLRPIGPELPRQLSSTEEDVQRPLGTVAPTDRVLLTETRFRWKRSEVAMPTEKLAETIRRSTPDALKMEARPVRLH